MINILSIDKSCATFGDSIEFSPPGSLLLANLESLEALANGLGDGGSHGFASFLGQLLGEFVGFGVFDVKAHSSTKLEIVLPVYHFSRSEVISKDRRGKFRNSSRLLATMAPWEPLPS